MRYQVRDPQGNLHEIEGPDGASPDEVLAAAKRTIPQREDPTNGMSTSERVLAGVGRAFSRAGLAFKEAMDVPAQALELTFGTFRPMGMPSAKESAAETKADLAEAEQLDKPLMRTTGGKVGDFVGNAAMMIPTAFVPGANTVTGAALIGGVTNAMTTPGGALERGAAGAFGAAGAAGGQYAGQKVGQWAAGKAADRVRAAESEKAVNAVRDSLLKESQAAGYRVPPATTNPTLANTAIESLGGKAATAQTFSVANQKVTNAGIRKDLGLAKDAPLTLETLKGIRAEQGKVYKEIADSGNITTDLKFHQDRLALGAEADRINLDFPDLNVGAKNEVMSLMEAINRDQFDARSAITAIKKLRADASENLKFNPGINKPNNKDLGRAQADAASAIEDQVIRHLETIGKKDLADQFDKARTLIAKTYSVQSALNESSGNVAAGNLAKQLKKGKYMSGDMELAARFAQSFPKAAQEIKDSPTVSALDALVTLGGGAITPAALAWPIARYGARQAMIRAPGMAHPSYAPNNAGLLALEKLGEAGMPLGLLGSVYAAK